MKANGLIILSMAKDFKNSRMAPPIKVIMSKGSLKAVADINGKTANCIKVNG